ncbi:MAG: copper resistance CopC/CopD family protein [Actinomycetota bacterium]
MIASNLSRCSNAARRVLLALAAALLVLALPKSAHAHAAFVSSDPPPGAELSSAPGVVVLRFTEPLIARLSGAVVTDPEGQTFEGQVTGERQMAVPLSTNAPGVYEVAWTTVSPVDGHTLRGAFRFGVGVAPGEGAEGATGTEPTREDLFLAVARALEYAALLIAVGMILIRRLARRPPPLGWANPRLAWPLALALGSGLAVVLGEALVAAGSPSPGQVAAYFTSGVAGVARLARVGLEALAVAAVMQRRSPAPSLVGALVALAAAGHAAAVTPRWWGVGVDALHLLAAGMWAGGIMALATVRPSGGWRGPAARVLLDRFSPIALAAFVATVGFGVLRGTQELSALPDLLTTSYGRVLGLKVLGVLIMVPLSTLLWLRLRGSPRVEAAVAGLVIALAALLAAYPLPPARLGEAEAAEQPIAGAAALPRKGDLTLGGDAGEVLVGLTIRPGEPGANDLLLYVLPLEGEEAAAGLRVGVSAGGPVAETEACGLTCRRAQLSLRGGERVEVQVGGKAGGTAIFDVPPLPPTDGTALYERMQERMHALRTYRLEESLSSGRAVVRADYAFQAPDRMRIRVDSGSERVIVGDREWRREGPGGRWRADQAISPEVPKFIWDFGGDPVGLRILGQENMDGIATTVLAFFGGSGNTPIWYRLWVDSEGLVRRAEMRAQGHFMDHRYFDFDAPFQVQPPNTG